MNRPNILMITCHDLGQHLGCYGVDSVVSKNLDKLASRGVRFSNFYSSSAVCSPGRGSLHTGRYPQSNGLMGLTHGPWWWKLNEDERHTAQILKELGYDTHLIGFNHVNRDYKRLGYNHYHHTGRDGAGTIAPATELIQAAANSDTPFFAKVGFVEVHRVFKNGSESSKGVSVPGYLQDTDDIREDLAQFQATIKFFDERVGEILDALEASEIASNTLVVMTSDHGIPYPGAKWTARKAGIEVPFIVYQPDTVFTGGKVFDEVMGNVDVLPTILDYLDADIPTNIQGVSFMSLINGETRVPPRTEAFAQYTPEMKRDNQSRCIINNKYHLIRYFDAGRIVDYPVAVNPQTFANHEQRCKTTEDRPFAQLYDIEKDPYELNDIGSLEENREIVAELSEKLLDWMKDLNDPLLKGPLRTPYYERAMADLLEGG